MNKTSSVFFLRIVLVLACLIIIASFAAAVNVSHISTEQSIYVVNATIGDGVSGESHALMSICDLPFWWWSWWMKGIYILVIGLAAWLGYRYVVSRMKLKEKLFRQQIQLENDVSLMNKQLQFFYDLSHEFLSPLTQIVHQLEQLQSDKVDPKQARYYYSLMNHNANQLVDLVNQLHNFPKNQPESMALKFVRSDLVSCIRKAASLFENIAKEKHILFSVSSSAEVIDVDFDPDKIGEIISNILSNAFRFTPPYGEISIHILLNELYPSKVVIEVTDNSDGIPVEAQERAFDVFYRVSEKNQKSTIRTSLGLAFVKELVALHNGEITLNSKPGKGSSFRIELPQWQKGVKNEMLDLLWNKESQSGSDTFETNIRSLGEQQLKVGNKLGEVTQSEFKGLTVDMTDDLFIKKVISIIEMNIEDPEFDSQRLAATLKMSRSQLYRKFKISFNRTVHDYIISVRMNKARNLLLSDEYLISDIAYKVGFTLPTNFTRTFTKYFGMSPSKFLSKQQG